MDHKIVGWKLFWSIGHIWIMKNLQKTIHCQVMASLTYDKYVYVQYVIKLAIIQFAWEVHI